MIISDLFEWRQSLRIFYFCIFWLLLPSHIDDLAIIRPEMFTFTQFLPHIKDGVENKL